MAEAPATAPKTRGRHSRAAAVSPNGGGRRATGEERHSREPARDEHRIIDGVLEKNIESPTRAYGALLRHAFKFAEPKTRRALPYSGLQPSLIELNGMKRHGFRKGYRVHVFSWRLHESFSSFARLFLRALGQELHHCLARPPRSSMSLGSISSVAARPRWPSSTSSRYSTTRDDDTRPSARSVRPHFTLH